MSRVRSRRDGLDCLATSFLAAAARFCADAAMLMIAGMPLALLRAHAASLGASLQRHGDDLLVGARASRPQRARGNADIGAVEVEADALTKLGHHVLGEASVGAGGAALSTGVAFLDTADEGLVHVALNAGMGRDHIVHMVHQVSP